MFQSVRERVPVSLCTGYKTVENTARDAVWGWEHGFRTYKMKCIVPERTPDLRDRIAGGQALGEAMAAHPPWFGAASGDVLAAVRVGQALGRNPVPIIIPCHRVIAADGSLGGYSGGGGLASKRLLLDLEGTLPDLGLGL